MLKFEIKLTFTGEEEILKIHNGYIKKLTTIKKEKSTEKL